MVALGILITVHEFGHFWVARRLGVKVLRFSVGFGKPLWSRRVGPDGMELAIGAFPLGGYVKMLDEAEGDVPASELHRAFNRQRVWKRMAIVVAGPLFNFIFAILAYWAVYMVGVDGIQPVVGKVAEDSIAQQAGFRAGDTILSIDGKEVQSWDHRRLYRVSARARPRAPAGGSARCAGCEVKTLELDLSNLPVQQVNASLLERGIGLIGYFPEALPVIGAIEPGPAQRAGMQVGDRLVEINSRAREHVGGTGRGGEPQPGQAPASDGGTRRRATQLRRHARRRRTGRARPSGASISVPNSAEYPTRCGSRSVLARWRR